MNPEYVAMAMFLGLLVSVFLGFPVAFTLIGLGIAFGLVGWGPGVFDMMISRTYFVTVVNRVRQVTYGIAGEYKWTPNTSP